jgi:Flp pilus assembly protein TadG
MVATTFFLLLFGVIDFSWALFNQMNVQDAVREAGRYAATGNTVSGLSRNASIVQVLNSYAMQSGASIQSVTISSVYGGSASYNETTSQFTGTGGAGGPSDTVTITATCSLPLLTGIIGQFFSANGTYNFTASATFRSEPFVTTPAP